MVSLLAVLYLLILPWIVIRLSEHWSWINKVSPMTVLYAVGLGVGNSGLLNSDFTSVCNTFSSLAVPFAIPLMLMGCSLSQWSTKKALKVFLSGLFSVLIVTLAGFYLFKGKGSLSYENYAQVCAVATGIYTGGIPNIGAIAQGVGMSHELYLLVTSTDLIVTALYLLFVIFCGKPFFRFLLPSAKTPGAVLSDVPASSSYPSAGADRPFRPFSKALRKGSFFLIVLTLLIVAISYAASLLPAGDGPNMTVLILMLSSLAIGCSFLPSVRKQTQSFPMGLYCVYVFCLSIATMVNVKDLDMAGNIAILYYIFFIIFGSIVLQVVFAKLLKLDGDSVLAGSVSLINSPPFVPLVAAILDNKDIVVLGISIGLLGYMVGNYLGIGIYHLLMALPS